MFRSAFKKDYYNLYDSILNEIEKVGLYEREFEEEVISEQIEMLKSNDDVSLDLMGFIYYKKQEILTDKYLRTFVNLVAAIKRYFTLMISDVKNQKIRSIIYCPKLLDVVHKNSDKIIAECGHKRFFDDETTEKIMKFNILDYFNILDTDLNNLLNVENCEHATVTPDVFLEDFIKMQNKIKSFCAKMRSEIESRNYYRDTKILVARTVELFLIVALTIVATKFVE